MASGQFPPTERRLLLSTRGIGAVVVQRLEQAGFDSLQALREAGTARVVERAGAHPAWHNRRRALQRALERAGLA